MANILAVRYAAFNCAGYLKAGSMSLLGAKLSSVNSLELPPSSASSATKRGRINHAHPHLSSRSVSRPFDVLIKCTCAPSNERLATR